MNVAECGGKEGLHVILIILEVLMDVEELVSRSAKKSYCLLGPGRLAEVDLCPKARGGEQYIPPGFADVRSGDQGFVHGELGITLPFREKKGDENEDTFG